MTRRTSATLTSACSSFSQPSAQSGDITSHPFVSLPQVAKPAKAQIATATQVAPLGAEQSPVSKSEGGATQSVTSVGVVNGAGGSISVNIGTLRPGDSVTITFQVVVDNPYSGGPNVSNQGTVSGTNFANVLTDDPATAAANDPTLTPINSIHIRVNDAKANEPSSGTTPMLFTVTLSNPAPAGGLTVNYATADDVGGANPATGGATCGGAVDYQTATGTLTFAQGESVKTIPVNVCNDTSSPETDEKFLLNLSSPSSGVFDDAQAVGTITQGNAPGTLLISELRTSGPTSVDNDFVEIYNNSDSPFTVPAGGHGLFKMGATCADAPVLIGTIPATTVIPARGHYLFVGSGYSLAAYAAGNQTLTANIEDDRNVALFTTASVASLSSATLLDAVGFDGNTGNNCDLLREGTNLPPAGGSTSEYSFVRRMETGYSRDTNDNASDLYVVSTTPTVAVGSTATPRLGAPGPENLASPILRVNSQISSTLIAPGVSESLSPNRTRDASAYTDTLTPSAPNGGAPASNPYTLGTLSVQRRFVNNTGAAVTRLRFRVVDITTFNSPNVTPVGTQADIRLLSSNGVTRAPASLPAGVTLRGLTLEQPPTQGSGGGWGSTVTVDLSVLPGGNLGAGQSVDVQFLLGVAGGGKFRFFVIVEGLP